MKVLKLLLSIAIFFSLSLIVSNAQELPSAPFSSSINRLTAQPTQKRIVTTSDGTLHTFVNTGSITYTCNGSSKAGLLWFYSTDSGSNWTCGEQLSSSVSLNGSAVKDSSDNIYIVYGGFSSTTGNTVDVSYRKLTKGVGSTWTFGSAHIVLDGASGSSGYTVPDIEIDSANRLWITTRFTNGTNHSVLVTNTSNLSPASSSDWSSTVELDTPGTTAASHIPQIIKFGTRIAVLYTNDAGSGILWRYRNDGDTTTTWQSEATVVGTSASGNFRSVVDSSNNIHLVYTQSTSGASSYTYYNGTSWSTPFGLGSSNFASGLADIATDGTSVWIIYADSTDIPSITNGNKTLYYIKGESPFTQADFDANGTKLIDGHGTFDKVWSYVASNYLNETTDASSSTTADITLPNSSGDILYLGKQQKFDSFSTSLSTSGIGGSITWQYWDGATWSTLTFSASSNHTLNGTTGWAMFTAPSDWATNSINGEGSSYYYIRAVVGTSFSTSPVGSAFSSLVNIQNVSTGTLNNGNLPIFFTEGSTNPYKGRLTILDTGSASPTPTPTPTPTPSPAPDISTISPSTGDNDETELSVWIAGTNFQDGATAKLQASGRPDINVSSITFLDENDLTGTINLNGASAGDYNVVVTNPDTQVGILADGFTVTDVSEPTPTPTPTSTPEPTPTITPNPQGGIIVDKDSIALFDQIPSQYLEAARNLKQVWIDRSVGVNISDGLTCLSANENYGSVPNSCRRHWTVPFTTSTSFTQTNFDQGTVPDVIYFDPSPTTYNRTNWVYETWDEYPGHPSTGEWFGKVGYFVSRANEILTTDPDVDVLSFQFSYLEIDTGSDIANLSTGYFADSPSRNDVGEIEDFEASNPDKVVIHWTTSVSRGIGTTEGEDFNEQMRTYAQQNDKYLLDAADILSHDPSGNPCYDNRDGVLYDNGNNSENHADDSLDTPAICQDYTTETDGGHLGSVSGGKIRMAKAYWVLMACIAGWDGCSANGSTPSLSLTPITPDPGTDTTPTLTGTASDSDGTITDVEYQIDSTAGSWTNCTATDGSFDEASETFTCSISTLSDGNRTIYVRTTDNDTNTTNNSDSYAVDTTAPSVPGTPNTNSASDETNPTWTWTASTDSISGLDTTPYTVQWSEDNTFLNGISTDTALTNSFSHTSPLSDGTWYFRVKAIDALGHESAYSNYGTFVLSTTNIAPSINISELAEDPTNLTSLEFTGTASDSDGTLNLVQYQLNSTAGVWNSCSADDGNFDEASEVYTCSLSSIPEGVNTIYVRSRDSNSSLSTNASDIFTVDTSVPEASLTAITPDPGNNDSPTLSGLATDTYTNINLVEFQVDSTSGSWSACNSSDGSFDEDSESFTCTTNSLSDGMHTINIRLTDEASNVTSSSYPSDTFRVDTTAPTLPGTPSTGSAGDDTTPSWTWTASTDSGSGLASDAYAIQWSEDNTFSGGITSSTSTSNIFTHTSSLSEGTWYFRVRAVDAATNQSEYSTAGSFTLSTSNEAPTLTLNGITTTTDRTPSFGGTASDSDGTISTIEYQVDSTSGSWTNCTASDESFDETEEEYTCTLTTLSTGTYTVYIRATDNNDLTSEIASDEFTITSSSGGGGGGGGGGSSPTPTPTPTSNCTRAFDDLDCENKFLTYIDRLKSNSIITGYSDGTFRPSSHVTRAEMATFVVRAFNLSADVDLNSSYFNDSVEGTHKQNILILTQLGIVGGFSDRTYRPDELVNREQISKFIYFALKAKGLSVEEVNTEFSDIDDQNEFKTYIGYIQSKGIVGGYSDGRFGPNDPLTREQMAKIIWLSRELE